jgi:serine phosphatase RsbU (regulator of sigma subunit)
VLQQLNQAILAEHDRSRRGGDDPRCCSLAYGRIARIGEDEVGDGLVVTLALGGHPQPLVRHCDGSVDVVGRPGPALGLTPKVEISEVAVHLRPGEVLLAYTDGVTDARRDGEEFGEDRLAGVLADVARGPFRSSGPVAAGLLADAVADRVLDAVQDFATSHDDMALLVMSVA